jgi:hypothetical protein
LRVCLGVAFVDQDVLAFDVAKLGETLTEHGNGSLDVWIFPRAEIQHADARHSRLRPSRKRQDHRKSAKRYEHVACVSLNHLVRTQ